MGRDGSSENGYGKENSRKKRGRKTNEVMN